MGMNEDDYTFLASRLEEISDSLDVMTMVLVSISQGEALWDADSVTGRTTLVEYRPWIVWWRKMKDRVLLSKDSFEMKWSD